MAGRGRITDRPVLDDYVARLAKDASMARPLKVAWDAGNGAAGEAMVRLVACLPGEHILLNERIDGTFPAHHPDPTVPENLEQLREAVLAHACDLGIAFDGDGDRIGVVDGKGRILWGDQFLVFLAKEVLGEHPGATIIADVKASQVLFDEIARMGGRPLMWRTGHSLIKAKMAETGAPLAGEMSGHIFFADRYYGYDDALYAAVRLLNVVARESASLAELVDRLPRVVNTPELRIPCSDERKFTVIEEVKARLAAEAAELVAVDGVRVKTATAGGCCAPPTPRQYSSPAARRQVLRRSSGSSRHSAASSRRAGSRSPRSDPAALREAGRVIPESWAPGTPPSPPSPQGGRE